MSKVKNPVVRNRMISHFYQADPEYGTALAKALNVDLSEVIALIKE